MANSDRSEYPAILATVHPSQAVNILNERIRTIGRANIEIADWLQERRKVEEQYVLSLRKLAKKQPPDDNSDLGIFQTPWQKIVKAIDALADSHHNLAQKITVDVETPLRDFATGNRDMQGLTTIQGNLGSLAKDYDAAQKKAEKISGRAGKSSAGKVANISSEVDNATAAWESQSPYVFESLQVVDETRCNHLRDVLTQLQTHEVDQIERSRKAAEGVLNSLLNLDTADEIKAFALKNTGNARNPAPRRSSRASSSAIGSRAERSTSESLMPPPPVPSADDRASQRSGSIQEEKKRGLGSGLKRLGTVMGRRRQSAIEPRPTPKKKGSSNYGSGLPTMAERPSASRESRDQPSPSAFTPLPPVRIGSTSGLGQVNGSNIESLDTPMPTAQSPTQNLQQPLQPQLANQAGRDDEIPPQVPAKDNEGFSVPPPSDDPISRAEREAAETSSGADVSAQPFKMDIRNAPISEESNGDTSAAMASMASTLRAQQSAMPKRSPTARGRRDQRNTVLLTSAEGDVAQSMLGQQSLSSSQMSLGSAMGLSQQASIPATAEHTRANESVDAQSIRSGRSLSSIGAGPARHPNLAAPGINASIIETLSAWQVSSDVTHATLIGEMALAFNPTNSSPSTTETIRLTNSPVLDTVVPNPSFVNSVPGKLGEYTVQLQAISQPTPTVAFKYQTKLSESDFGPLAPLIIKPSWKIEAIQASAIVTYSINPAFAATLKSPVTLSNVIIALYLDGTTAVSCQSKPQGTFVKEKSMIYWKIDDLMISPARAVDNMPSKVIARFMTPSQQGKEGKVDAKWEMAGQGVQGSGLDISRLASGPAGADPFADEDGTGAVNWQEVSLTKRIIAGTYTAT